MSESSLSSFNGSGKNPLLSDDLYEFKRSLSQWLHDGGAVKDHLITGLAELDYFFHDVQVENDSEEDGDNVLGAVAAMLVSDDRLASALMNLRDELPRLWELADKLKAHRAEAA